MAESLVARGSSGICGRFYSVLGLYTQCMDSRSKVNTARQVCLGRGGDVRNELPAVAQQETSQQSERQNGASETRP